MSTANLLYTDTEDALRDSVRRLFADRCQPEAVVALYDHPDVDFTDTWKTLAAELGLAGLLVPDPGGRMYLNGTEQKFDHLLGKVAFMPQRDLLLPWRKLA